MLVKSWSFRERARHNIHSGPRDEAQEGGRVEAIQDERKNLRDKGAREKGGRVEKWKQWGERRH